MATTELNLAEELIEMILRSKTISPEEQKSYIERIMKGEFTPEMQEELATIFENEVRRLDGHIHNLSEAITNTEAQYTEEWHKIAPDAERIAAEHEQEVGAAVADFHRECDHAEKEAEHEVEGAVRQDEQSQADAIRQSLKKKP